MLHKFKCCTKKDFGNYICIVCFDIYHPSCLERKNGFVKIKQHKFLCSTECQTIFESNEGIVSDLNDQITSLTGLLKEKDSVISRLRRRTQDFEDMALESEQELLTKLEESKSIIDDLQKKLQAIKLDYDELLKVIARNEEYIQSLVKDKQELDTLQRNMLSAFSTLEADNKCLQSELQTLRDNTEPENQVNSVPKCYRDASTFNDNSANQSIPLNQSIPIHSVLTSQLRPNNSFSSSKRKMLLLSDDNGKHLCKALSNCKNLTKFIIESIHKPGGKFADILESVDLLSKDYTQKDVIVILAGKGDFESNKHPKVKDIWSKIKNCLHTNIIFLSCPTVIRKYFNIISKFNMRLHDFLSKVNNFSEQYISLVNINNARGSKIGNDLIAEHIASEVKRNWNNVKCLTFVKTTSILDLPPTPKHSEIPKNATADTHDLDGSSISFEANSSSPFLEVTQIKQTYP
ncbi:uncharacterized protein [Leptinotarsa decemlineata]|uniref:uncharacterized protein n=1 Tax=Leptinotarsa decemlineata TaxID=7539 RepID=UPI003D30799D